MSQASTTGSAALKMGQQVMVALLHYFRYMASQLYVAWQVGDIVGLTFKCRKKN